VSPKRGDRAAPPPKAGEYDVRFADNQIAAAIELIRVVVMSIKVAGGVGGGGRRGPPQPAPRQKKHD
jgi:hypothetical protein